LEEQTRDDGASPSAPRCSSEGCHAGTGTHVAVVPGPADFTVAGVAPLAIGLTGAVLTRLVVAGVCGCAHVDQRRREGDSLEGCSEGAWVYLGKQPLARQGKRG